MACSYFKIKLKPQLNNFLSVLSSRFWDVNIIQKVFSLSLAVTGQNAKEIKEHKAIDVTINTFSVTEMYAIYVD